MRNKKHFWRINSDIRAPEVRVLLASGEQLGVMPRVEALRQAKKAKLDLVEIVPQADPPVVKIIDFGKFRYQEEKRLQAQKKKVKSSGLKEIRFSPFIAEGDYQTRLKRVTEFLDDGNKVRLVVVFKGRQMGSKQFGYSLLQKIIGYFGDRIVTDMEPKFLGRHLAMVISPVKRNKNEKKSETEDKEVDR